jgi:hypothetical protein
MPASSHSSDVGAKHAESLSKSPAYVPPADILYLLDESLERYIRDLAQKSARPEAPVALAPRPAPGPPPSAGNVGGSSAPKPAAQPAADPFEIGDRVRLRPGKTGSSVAALKPGKPAGALYCGRAVGKVVLPPNGTCSESGPYCPSCRACVALGVKETKTASDACLGAAKDGREGVVKAVRLATGAGARLVRVVSVHSGHVCYYAPDDLMYADGSLPGGAQHVPMLGGATPAAGGGGGGSSVLGAGSAVPADWGAAYVASVEVSTDASGNGPQVPTHRDLFVVDGRFA